MIRLQCCRCLSAKALYLLSDLSDMASGTVGFPASLLHAPVVIGTVPLPGQGAREIPGHYPGQEPGTFLGGAPADGSSLRRTVETLADGKTVVRVYRDGDTDGPLESAQYSALPGVPGGIPDSGRFSWSRSDGTSGGGGGWRRVPSGAAPPLGPLTFSLVGTHGRGEREQMRLFLLSLFFVAEAHRLSVSCRVSTAARWRFSNGSFDRRSVLTRVPETPSGTSLATTFSFRRPFPVAREYSL